MFFIEPLEYLSFVYLMEKATIVLTDSGGIQEEAPGLGKPVLVMRETTERPEALEAGTVKLVGTNCDKIINEISDLLENEVHYDKMSKAINPYGDGMACDRITRFVMNYVSKREYRRVLEILFIICFKYSKLYFPIILIPYLTGVLGVENMEHIFMLMQ